MRIKDYTLETIIVVRQMIVTLFQTIVKPFYIECYKTQTKVIITASQKERKISQNPMKVKVKSGKLPEVLKKIAADQAVICLKLIGQEVFTSFPDQLKSTAKLNEMQSWIKFRFSEIAQLFGSNMLTFNFNITKSREGLQDISPSSLSPCCS